MTLQNYIVTKYNTTPSLKKKPETTHFKKTLTFQASFQASFTHFITNL